MKKTLITLAALAMASVASAASDGVADYKFESPAAGTITQKFSSASGEFTMIAILDWDALMSDAISDAWDNRTDIFSLTSSHWQWGQMWLNGPTLFRGNSGTTLELGIQTDDKNQAISGGDGNNVSLVETSNDSSKLTYGNYGKLVLAYTFANGTVTAAALQSDGSTWSTATFATGWAPYQAFDTIDISVSNVIDSLVIYDDVLTGSALTYAAMTSIPEPATATLSLLALAGLAARRRRK